MKILLVNLTKMVGDTGGTAKVNCAFANEMTERGHEVATVYSDDKEGDTFFPLSDKVKVYNLRRFEGKVQKIPLRYKIMRELVRGFSKKRAATINEEFTKKSLLGNMRKILESFAPDVIVGFQPAAAKTCLLDLKTKIPFILMAHGDTEDWFHNYPDEQVEAIGKCDVCQVLMPSFVESLKKRYPDLKTVVIGNVVPQYKETADLTAHKDKYKIIFIGRLVKNHKRPHLLIEAFSRLAKDFPEWTVEIWGAEDKKSYVKEMRKRISKSGLEARITLNGTTNDVEHVLESGDLFVFPSAYEGFGLTPAEAMSKGLPVIAYASCPAVNELVKDGVTGYLVKDGAAPLEEKMRLLMKDQELRAKLGKQAHEAMRCYAPKTIWDTWDKLLEKTKETKDSE